MADPRHIDCWLSEPCLSSGDEINCHLQPVRERRAREGAGAWSELELRDRHYLDGEPVHCGQPLELQAVEERNDDCGTYSVPLQRGTVVRYEAEFVNSGEPRAYLFVDVAGHLFSAAWAPWMRFRWPRRP